MRYFGWQIDMKDPKQSISDALKRYIEKMGMPPRLLLISNQLETVEVPQDMNLVVKVHRVPVNILLIGVMTNNENDI